MLPLKRPPQTQHRIGSGEVSSAAGEDAAEAKGDGHGREAANDYTRPSPEHIRAPQHRPGYAKCCKRDG